MTGKRNERLRGSIKGDDRRQERLARELRENLKRRKARAPAPANVAGHDPGTSDPDAGGPPERS